MVGEYYIMCKQPYKCYPNINCCIVN